jgi:hypothetical protein
MSIAKNLMQEAIAVERTGDVEMSGCFRQVAFLAEEQDLPSLRDFIATQKAKATGHAINCWQTVGEFLENGGR